MAAKRRLDGQGPSTSMALGTPLRTAAAAAVNQPVLSRDQEGIHGTDMNRLKHDSRGPCIHWMPEVNNIEF
jgi:hypothetical protein